VTGSSGNFDFGMWQLTQSDFATGQAFAVDEAVNAALVAAWLVPPETWHAKHFES
jgi:hypothetical protein